MYIHDYCNVRREAIFAQPHLLNPYSANDKGFAEKVDFAFTTPPQTGLVKVVSFTRIWSLSLKIE
jgi:hypothetical protein